MSAKFQSVEICAKTIGRDERLRGQAFEVCVAPRWGRSSHVTFLQLCRICLPNFSDRLEEM